MFVYVSKVFTAQATGCRLKEVTCEKCGKHFFYELARIGVGTSSAPYMLGQDRAQSASQSKAARDLQKRLAADEETVPCPACQWINPSAVRSYRKTRQRGWTFLALALGLLGGVISLLFLGMSRDIVGHALDLHDPHHWIIAATWISLVALCFSAQGLLRRRIDPNRLHNGKKRLPVGTPPALVPLGENAQGELQYEVVPYDRALYEAPSKWAIFRAGQLALVPLCCRCLGEPGSVPLKLPFVAREQPLPVPLCESCRKAILRAWWRANLASFAAAWALAWLLACCAKGIDPVGRVIMVIFVGGVLAVIGLCAVDELIRPYRIKTVDGERGIGKVRFRNPAYTAMLMRKIGEAEGYFKAEGPLKIQG